jgi:MFS family permease
MTQSAEPAAPGESAGTGESAAAGIFRPQLLRGPRDRRALSVMTIAHGIQHFNIAGLAVSYPFVVTQFHVSYAVLGVVLTIAGLVGGFLQASAGLLRRLSARAVISVQDAGLAAATVLAAFAPGFGVFAGARILGNSVSWPQHPVGSAYLSDRFPHRRATVLSWHTAGGSIGTVTVPLILSAVIAAAGWRTGLVVLGAVLLAGALLVRVALPVERPPATASDGQAAVPEPAVPLLEVLMRRRVLALLVASTVAAGGRGLGVLTTYIPAFLRSGLHLPTLTVGALFTVVVAASIAGPVVGGMLADRFGRVRTLVVTYVAGAAALAAFGYAGRNIGVLAALGVCVGVLAYTESPLLQAVFSDLALDGSARSAFGAFFAISFGIGSLWTAAIGWIVTAAGFSVAFAVMAGSFVAAATVITALVRE